MRRAERALYGKAGFRGKCVTVRGLGVEDENFVEKKILRVNEASLEECFQQGVDAVDDLGVSEVLL